MPGRSSTVSRNSIWAKDLPQALLLAGSIMLMVLLIYFAQTLFYRHNNFSLSNPPGARNRISCVTANDVFDLSGSEASGGGNPFHLFDEQVGTAAVLPAHPNTNPLPAGLDIFYPPGRGLRIVIDLHDVYALSDVYFYDKSLESDSVWVYTGDLRHWKPSVAYTSTAHCAAWGWRHFPVTDSTRYVMIRFNSYRSIISELALYGRVQQHVPAATTVRLPLLPAPTMREFAGTNAYDYVPPGLLKPFNQVRLYQQLDYFDTDTVNAYPKNYITLNSNGIPTAQQTRYYADSLRKMGNHLWMSIRGLPRYLEQKGMSEKDKPVTILGMNTEDPLSYGRHAAAFWTMAALFGNTPVDTGLIRLTGTPKFSGLGLMDRFENGNEEDGYWSKYYWTPMDYFAVSSADYDGDEGRLGPTHGLHAADPGIRLMTSGMIQLDTNRVKTLNFLCSQLRQDKKFIWQGGVQYHYYSNAQTKRLQSPTKGISPEQDSMRMKLARVRAFHNRLLPGIPLILGENGYDRNQHSWQATPLLPGYTEAQSQGIMNIRSLMAAFMAGFDGYNQYMMRNATNDENLPGAYATSGMIGGPAKNVIYPAWYYWSAVVQHLGNYQPDSILSESGAVWIYRLKDRENTAKKAYVLFSPTVNGTVIKNFNFKLYGDKDQLFTLIKLLDNNPAGAVSKGKLLHAAVTLSVGESPVILVMD